MRTKKVIGLPPRQGPGTSSPEGTKRPGRDVSCRAREKWSGRMYLNCRPPGPESWRRVGFNFPCASRLTNCATICVTVPCLLADQRPLHFEPPSHHGPQSICLTLASIPRHSRSCDIFCGTGEWTNEAFQSPLTDGPLHDRSGADHFRGCEA